MRYLLPLSNLSKALFLIFLILAGHRFTLSKTKDSPQQDPEDTIKDSLRVAAENMTMGTFGNDVAFANMEGHSILEDHDTMKRDISVLKKKVEEKSLLVEGHGQQIQAHEQRIKGLEGRVLSLTTSSQGYRDIRKRFFDTYKRDVKKMPGFTGSKAISEGNVRAHEGDVLSDALLFQIEKRTDRSIFAELYGLDYQQVLDFGPYTDYSNHIKR